MNFLPTASQSMKNPANVLLLPFCSLRMVTFMEAEVRLPEAPSWRTHLERGNRGWLQKSNSTVSSSCSSST